MESLMIQKLREALANTTKAEFQREWAEIQAMGLKGPTVSELLAYQHPPASYLPDNSGEGGDSSAQRNQYTVTSEQNIQLAFAA
jgi:hypothetical protein